MNLVDAIRLTSGQARQKPAVGASLGADACVTHAAELNTDSETKHEDGLPVPSSDLRPPNSEPQTMSNNFVRIELFLSPDQIQGLLRETVGSHRSIMTVREVAHLLRTTSHNVERLAEEGKLPGFLLDDSWRFHRSAVDEWLANQVGTDAA